MDVLEFVMKLVLQSEVHSVHVTPAELNLLASLDRDS